MGILDNVVNQVKNNLTFRANQGVTDAINKGTNAVFQKGSPADKCPKCKKKLSQGGLKFCPECGEKLMLNCPKCNVDFPLGTKFCTQCGGKLK